MRISLNHPFIDGFPWISLVNHSFWGNPHGNPQGSSHVKKQRSDKIRHGTTGAPNDRTTGHKGTVGKHIVIDGHLGFSSSPDFGWWWLMMVNVD